MGLSVHCVFGWLQIKWDTALHWIGGIQASSLNCRVMRIVEVVYQWEVLLRSAVELDHSNTGGYSQPLARNTFAGLSQTGEPEDKDCLRACFQ